MSEVSVSVIIPVYNVEKTLDRCLESIISQDFENYEIVLVNDGSTDSSGKICDRYAEKYPFIRVIHKENEGLGPTRNVGVLHANGKYVYHCDSDDWISPGLLKDCYEAAENSDANIVIFGYTIYTDQDMLKEYQNVTVPASFFPTKEESRAFFVKQFNNSFVVQSACNRLLKRDFLIENDIWFKPFRRCQDVVFSLDLFEYATRVLCLEKSYYNYIIAPGTYKGRSYDEMLSIYLDVYEYISNRMKVWGVWNKENKEVITTLYMAHISNYVSFYLMNRSKCVSKDIKRIINDEKIQALFTECKESPSSMFLTLVKQGIIRKATLFLRIVFWLHERRKKQ